MGTSPSFSLAEIAELLAGDLEEGNHADIRISGIADLSSAQEHHLSFLGNKKYEPAARQTRAGAILVEPAVPSPFPCPVIRVPNASQSFALIASKFAPPPIQWEPGIHPTAIIAQSATIGKDCHIGPYAIIEPEAQIGERTHIGSGSTIGHYSRIGHDTFLYPHVTLRERTLLGSHCILHSGTVIGSDGFGYEFSKGRHEKVPQIGYVQIDDHVEIGANSTVDRGRFDRTWIQEGCKIDNQVMIAHNVTLGKHCIIVAQSGMSGSSRCGNYVTIAGHSGTVGHITIGDRSTITAMTGVAKDVPAGQILAGRHGRPIKEAMKIEAATHKLPELLARLKELEKQIEQLRQRDGNSSTAD